MAFERSSPVLPLVASWKDSKMSVQFSNTKYVYLHSVDLLLDSFHLLATVLSGTDALDIMEQNSYSVCGFRDGHEVAPRFRR